MDSDPRNSRRRRRRIFLGPAANTQNMHIAGVVASVIIGIYTMSWAWTLYKKGNRAGAFWSGVLAIASSATALYYFYQQGFLP